MEATTKWVFETPAKATTAVRLWWIDVVVGTMMRERKSRTWMVVP